MLFYFYTHGNEYKHTHTHTGVYVYTYMYRAIVLTYLYTWVGMYIIRIYSDESIKPCRIKKYTTDSKTLGKID